MTMRNKILLPLFAYLFSVYTSWSQSLPDGLIQEKSGLSKASVRLEANEQLSFNPSAAKTLLGIDSRSDLVLIRRETDQLGQEHYRFHQQFAGFPIEDAVYILHAKQGMLLGMDGRIVLDFKTHAGPPANPYYTKEEAVTIAMEQVKAEKYAWQDENLEKEMRNRAQGEEETYYPDPVLVWYAPGEKMVPEALRLAYKVDIYALVPLSRSYFFIDAMNGQVLGKKDRLFFSDATGTASTGYSGTQVIHSDLSGYTYRLRDYTKGYGIITRYGNTSADYVSTTANWNLTGIDQYALDAHYGVAQTYTYYKTVFNRNSIDNNGYALYSYANESNTTDNAYWNGSSMHFGIRSGATPAGVCALDVTAHELTHGLTQFTSNLNYSYESGAINESMSDIMGKSVQFWSKPDNINWVLSNDMNWSIRNLSNPNQFSHPDTYHGSYWYGGTGDNGGVHTNSGVGNYMFYLLVSGGSGINDLGNAFTVSGLGLTKADAIIYRSETVYLTPTSQYADWRTACINAATDLYGAGSNEVIQVQNAWYAVGVGASPLPVCSGNPAAGTVSPSSQTVCNNTAATLVLSGYPTGVNGIIFQWKSSPDGVTFTTIAGASASTYITPKLTSKTYYLCTLKCASGATVNSNTTSVSTMSAPVPFAVTGGGAYCSGGGGVPVNLAGSESGVSYQLKVDNNTTGSPVNGTGSSISFGNQTLPGNYSAVATTVANGCTLTIPSGVTVTADLFPAVTTGSNSPLCAGNTLNLFSKGGTTYSWTGPNGYASTLQLPVLANVTTANTGTYSVTVSNACGSSSAAVPVTVNPLPTPSASCNSPLCAGSTLTLFSSGGVTYAWKGERGQTYAQQNPVISNITAANAGLYTVTVTNNFNCSALATTAVEIAPLITASGNSPICMGGTINLSAGGGKNIFLARPQWLYFYTSKSIYPQRFSRHHRQLYRDGLRQQWLFRIRHCHS
jgi:Zn-dependent metalloprotease